MKNILIIRSSARKAGNSNLLAEEFTRGARASGHKITDIWLMEYTILPCRGCYACEGNRKCYQQDDMKALLPLLECADVIVFSTPVYFYSMSGQLKTFLDRTMPLYFKTLSPKEVYLLTACESTSPNAPDGTLQGIQGWISCFANITFKAGVYSLGVLKCSDIKGHPELIHAYTMGKEV